MDFIKGNWSRYVDVHDFIQHNYTPYDGDESFLSPPTEKTKKLWAQVRQLENGKYCVVNNTYEPQETTVYCGDGSSFFLKLEANEIKWYSI